MKESRFGTEAELFGGGSGDSAAGGAPEVSFGRVEGVESLEAAPGPPPGDAIELQAILGEALTYETFAGALSKQIEALGIETGEPLISVDVGAMPGERQFPDAAPATTPDVTVDQLPSERGNAPQPVDPGGQPNLDADE